MMLAYLLHAEADDNGTLLVTCPAFPEMTTFAENATDIPEIASAALEEAIAARISDGEEVPRPASAAKLRTHRGPWVKLPTLTSLKVFLYMALRESGINRSELARRLGWHREQVDRLFRIDHLSRVEQLEAAFKALGREIDVEVKELARA
jgi:antitoxin HicB